MTITLAVFFVSCAYLNFSVCIKFDECFQWFNYGFLLLCFPYYAQPDLKVAQITPARQQLAENGGVLGKFLGMRVPALPIRNCRERSNTSDPRRPKVSAIDVTEKTVHERLVLVSDDLFVNMPLALAPSPFHTSVNSRNNQCMYVWFRNTE